MGSAAKKMEYPTEHHSKMDEMLRQVSELSGELAGLQAKCQADADALALKHKGLTSPIKEKLEILEKAVKVYAKKHQVELFEGKDRLDLSCGALLHQVEERVRRARDVLQRLEEIGAVEAIKIAKSVDWDLLETWTDERLIEIGTERVKKETFAYELFAGGRGKK